ncbi:MAG: hypothetical protein QNJ98_15660 [Planctomycetota bacterium]|nr:hypothetical protein [Planctomycetota bacterium]
MTQWLKANGADLLAIEEVERRQSLTTEEPGVLHTTGRSYYDSD